jgi:hypothetical protein
VRATLDWHAGHFFDEDCNMRQLVPMRAHFSDRPLSEPPFTEAFVFERRFLEDSTGGFDSSVVYSNVPHLCVKHSPSGFEFSFAGSGPADAALNCLEAALIRTGYRGPRAAMFEGSCFVLAEVLYQTFKTHFIAVLPEEGGTIPFATVVQWIADQREFLTEHQRERLAPRYALTHPDYRDEQGPPEIWTLGDLSGLFPDRVFSVDGEQLRCGGVVVGRLYEEFPLPQLP